MVGRKTESVLLGGNKAQQCVADHFVTANLLALFYVAHHRAGQNPLCILEHCPGDKLYIDFAGKLFILHR